MSCLYRYYACFKVEWKIKDVVIQSGLDKTYNKMLQDFFEKEKKSYNPLDFSKELQAIFFATELDLVAPLTLDGMKKEEEKLFRHFCTEVGRKEARMSAAYQVEAVKVLGYFPLETADDEFAFRKTEGKKMTLMCLAKKQDNVFPFLYAYEVKENYKTIYDWLKAVKKDCEEKQSQEEHPIIFEELIVVHGVWL